MPEKRTRTESEWEIAQAELGELRKLRTAIERRGRDIQSGRLTTQAYLEWLWPALVAHDKLVLTQAKSIAVRYKRMRKRKRKQIEQTDGSEVSNNGLPSSTVEP